MRKKKEQMDKKMNKIMAENTILKESLKTTREEVEKLRKQVRMIGHFSFFSLGLMGKFSDHVYCEYLL